MGLLTTPQEVLTEIIKDAEADAHRYDGMPFNGKTLAQITGEQNAMIMTLAEILREHLGYE